MVGQLMVLGNPKKKKRKARRMSALQRKYFGKRKGKKRKARRSKGETVIIATSNPRRHHVKKRRRRRTIRARTNPRKRRYIRARRNPRILGGGAGGFLSNSLIPAAVGAAGAIAVDLAIGNLTFLPASMKSGAGLPITRIGLSLLAGMAVGAIAGEEYGEQAAAGGMIVALYALAKNYMTTKMPNVRMARYMPLNRYLGARRRRMGFIRRRLGAMPPAQRVRAIRAMKGMRGFRRRMGVPALNGAPFTKMRVGRSGKSLGYIGPARTMGRYMNNGR